MEENLAQILLLDEADVFLHKRSMTDLMQNALVSVFLRQLEYYQGILIMMTNMMKQIDPAFESTPIIIFSYKHIEKFT